VNTEGTQADPGAFAPGYATALNWRVAYARRLGRLGVEAGCDAIVWVSALCYAAWITTDIRGSRIGGRQLGAVRGSANSSRPTRAASCPRCWSEIGRWNRRP
jgi:hypothetical protein